MLLLLVVQVLLYIQRLLAIWRHHRAIRLLPRLPGPAQRCGAGIRRPHHTLALQIAPLVLQIHLEAQPASQRMQTVNMCLVLHLLLGMTGWHMGTWRKVPQIA